MATATSDREQLALFGEFRVELISAIEVEAGFNNRRALGDLAELTASIKSVGLLEPLVVRPTIHTLPGAGRKPWTLVAGHRRLAAAKAAGLTLVPVIVRDLDEIASLEVLLVENLHRLDLDPLEEADGYRRLCELGLKQFEVAEKVGRSQAHVSKRLSLLELPEVARTALDKGEINLSDALGLTALKDSPERIADALKAAGSWEGTAGRTAKHVAELEAAAKRKATRERLDAEGVKVAGEARDRWDRPDVEGRASLGGYQLPGISVEDHQKLKCHAAWIGWDGEVTWVCTSPASHTKAAKGAKPVKSQWERDREQREAKQEERERQRAARLEFYRRLVDGKQSAALRDYVLGGVFWVGLAEAWNGDFAEKIANLLPLDLVVDAEGDFEDVAAAAVSDWMLAGGPGRQERVALATTLVCLDEAIQQQLEEGPSAAALYQLRALEAFGFHLTDEQRAVLEAAAGTGGDRPTPAGDEHRAIPAVGPAPDEVKAAAIADAESLTDRIARHARDIEEAQDELVAVAPPSGTPQPPLPRRRSGR